MPIALNTLVNSLLTFSGQAIRNHPKRLTALIAALALGGGGGAFAIASFAPDPADLPVSVVTEPVSPLATQTAIDSLSATALTLYRSDITRSTDTAETLLKRLGINDPTAAAFLRTDANVRKSVFGRSGRNVTAEADANNALLKLTARWAPQDDGNFTRLIVEKSPSGLVSRVEILPLVASMRLASGTIQSSLFAATDEANLPDSIATQVAEIFSGDIDFHRALRKGDRFSITYEALEGDGEPLKTGKVLSAEFVNNGKTYQAMWFAQPGQKGAYYTLDGQSLHRAFLASPMEFSRVTSGFKMRFHPILQTWKAHLGVDYAAPTGTPVRTVGDGVVEFAGVQNGFGNVIFIDHGNNNTTVYAHLSHINVHKGEKVTQSETIGAVGQTGWATGPHLHFEFRINGVHHDPLTIARTSEAVPVTAALKPQFDLAATNAKVALAAAATMQRSSAD